MSSPVNELFKEMIYKHTSLHHKNVGVYKENFYILTYKYFLEHRKIIFRHKLGSIKLYQLPFFKEISLASSHRVL